MKTTMPLFDVNNENVWSNSSNFLQFLSECKSASSRELSQITLPQLWLHNGLKNDFTIRVNDTRVSAICVPI